VLFRSPDGAAAQRLYLGWTDEAEIVPFEIRLPADCRTSPKDSPPPSGRGLMWV
jgi:hypothetical protein